MHAKTVAELRLLASTGSEPALLELLTRFNPLLNKYSRKFEYEYTFSELQLLLISLIKNFPLQANDWNDAQTVSYIAKSVYTNYIKLSKRNDFHENNLIEYNPNIAEEYYTTPMDEKVILQEMLQGLTDVQQEVIIRHYIYGYSIQEIAELRGISRQAVNKIKNQALQFLKNNYDIINSMSIPTKIL